MPTCATATARRLVTGLSPTSIMRISDIGAKPLMRQGRFVPELVDRVFRGDIQRSVDIDQGAVEIEEDRFEFALR